MLAPRCERLWQHWPCCFVLVPWLFEHCLHIAVALLSLRGGGDGPRFLWFCAVVRCIGVDAAFIGFDWLSIIDLPSKPIVLLDLCRRRELLWL